MRSPLIKVQFANRTTVKDNDNMPTVVDGDKITCLTQVSPEISLTIEKQSDDNDLPLGFVSVPTTAKPKSKPNTRRQYMIMDENGTAITHMYSETAYSKCNKKDGLLFPSVRTNASEISPRLGRRKSENNRLYYEGTNGCNCNVLASKSRTPRRSSDSEQSTVSSSKELRNKTKFCSIFAVVKLKSNLISPYKERSGVNGYSYGQTEIKRTNLFSFYQVSCAILAVTKWQKKFKNMKKKAKNERSVFNRGFSSDFGSTLTSLRESPGTTFITVKPTDV